MAYRLTQEELDQQFEQFLKESFSDDSVDLGSSSKRSSVLDNIGKAPKQQQKKKSRMSVPWWQEDEDSDETQGKAFGKTFLKSLRKSQTVQEVDEDQVKEQCFHDETKEDSVMFSKDSLEPEDSLRIYESAQSATALGLQTLNEEVAHASFLANVSEDSRLNKDQESLSTGTESPQREEGLSLMNPNQSVDEERDLSSAKDTPASPAYSDDFEDEASDKEPEVKKPERCDMLAKESLHDSLNSMDGAPGPALCRDVKENTEYPDSRTAQAAGPKTTGLSYGQSVASDIEALQDAYRQITHSVECEERSTSPFSLSSIKRLKRTTQLDSTAESDLPTAEELMRVVGPDSTITAGLCLDALSFSEAAVDMKAKNLDSEDHSAIAKAKHSPVALRQADSESPEALEPYQTSSHHRHTSITDEVKRLMQEQDNFPEVPPTASGKGKKSLVWPEALSQTSKVPRRSTTTAPFSATSGKATVSSVRNKKTEIKPLPKASTPTRPNRLAKPPSPLTQRKSPNQTSKRMSSLSQTHVVKGPDTGLKVSNELVASIQSIATFLQRRMEADVRNTGCPDQSDSNRQLAKQSKREMEKYGASVHDPQLENSLLEQIHLQHAQKEREFLLREKQLQQEHSKEIHALKQENYMLQSKLHSAEEASKKQRWSFGEDSDPRKDEKLRLIEKELKEQETLIKNYQLENEKLYLQMKTLQVKSKQNEEAMFKENQRLLTEIAVTKEQLNKSSEPKTVGNISTAVQGCNDELLAELQAAQRRESQLQEECRRFIQEKQATQVDLQMIKKERDLAKAQVISTSGDKGLELKLLEERHKEELAALKKRLQWYAENQELLDKDAARLRAANAEMQKLTEQVEKLKMEVAKQANHQQQKKGKERATEAKKIQDLERQVKEMEEILRRRHPNSLPALMLAAAAADGGRGGESYPCAASQPSNSAALLERRIHRLEAELENRDEEAKRSLRAMEQHFHRIKLQYEEQISDLEQRLAEQGPKCRNGSSKKLEMQSDTVQELEQLKELHQSEVNTLVQAKVATFEEQLQQVHSSAQPEKPSRHQKQAEAAHITRMERLNQELTTKSRTIQELKRTVERLQRERKNMLFSPKLQRSSALSKQTGKDQSPILAETFPSTQDEKDYQPGVFSDSHISEVQQENERLRVRQEQIEQQWLKERASLQAAATEAQAELQRAKDLNLEQLALLKADHQREKERLVASHALEHSSSRVAELANQVKSQEVMVLHLREQLKELQKDKEALTLSKLREKTLQNQLTKLLEELKQAKETHSPELRHFASLEHKIYTMELRYNQREQELQQIIAQNRLMVEQEQQAEVAQWKRLAQGKSSELEAFRQELDAILDVLRELQKQGVVIPATQYSSASGCMFQHLR